MSRHPPSDVFTRFTSTAPPSSQPSFTSNRTSQTSRHAQNATPGNPQSSRPPPPSSSETPAERVARLRAASRLAKEQGALSPVDRLISRGRLWADIAHRVTTYGLLAFTGVSTVVAVYGLVSLVSHNRRQKRAWIEREMDRLNDARQAFLRGEADAEQLHLLEQERAGDEIAKRFQEDRERRKKEGFWGKVKGTFGTFTAKGDMGVEDSISREQQRRKQGLSGDAMVETLENIESSIPASTSTLKPVAVQESNIAGVGLDEKGRPVPINKMEKVRSKVEHERRTGEKAVVERTGIVGGPLDVLAGNAIGAIVPDNGNNKGWFSWISGSGKPS